MKKNIHRVKRTRRGDFLIVDDPLKPIAASSASQRGRVNKWLKNTLLSRLDDNQADAIIVPMRRGDTQ